MSQFLKYIGDAEGRGHLPNVPPWDMTLEEAARYDAQALADCGLYVLAEGAPREHPSVTAERAQLKAAAEEEAKRNQG